MKLEQIKIKNFRGYKNETIIDFDNLTALVGKNDVGKSTILEALDLFFNDGKGVIKGGVDDVNVTSLNEGDKEIIISACFGDVPDTVVIDATNSTSLQQEYLLNEAGQLEIVKKYVAGASSLSSAKVFIRALHPGNLQCNNLLSKTATELRRIITDQNIVCNDRTRNAEMRQAIWLHYSNDLQIVSSELDVTKGDVKSIWGKLSTYLPVYSLFQSDRKNSDSDSEVQDPLKQAVKEILGDPVIQQKLDEVAIEVQQKLSDVANRTLEKLQEMSPEIASTLSPTIPGTASLKWNEVFKNVTITGDENIPINKRGSGVRRLILLNFFRAEAERRLTELNATDIIYAIEEPETSQHTENQKKLIDAFLALASVPHTQIIVSTHSAQIVKRLSYDNVRLITCGDQPIVTRVESTSLPYPSLNEVNYLAFGEISVEYHDELYGHLEYIGQMDAYEQGQDTREYHRYNRRGDIITQPHTITHYIRDQIHHPENRLNPHYTDEDLRQSILLMRRFLQSIANGDEDNGNVPE